MKKAYTIIFTFILAFYSWTAFAVDGDPVIEGLVADRVLTSSLESVSSIDATTEATLENALDHDDITGAGTLDTETEIEAGIDHDDISGAGTVDTAAEVQGVSVGGDLSGTVGNATESDPVYSAWDKDYADLINTPDLFDLLGLADPDADKYPMWDDSETAWAWADGGSMPYPGAGIAVSTGSAWDTSITDNSANWNTAYSWGDHSTEGYWSSSNDGPGSGLDADLWDGYEFSSYLNQAVLSSSTPTFATVKLTNLTDGYVPYHSIAGLVDSSFRISGSDAFMESIYDADTKAYVQTVYSSTPNIFAHAFYDSDTFSQLDLVAGASPSVSLKCSLASNDYSTVWLGESGGIMRSGFLSSVSGTWYIAYLQSIYFLPYPSNTLNNGSPGQYWASTYTSKIYRDYEYSLSCLPGKENAFDGDALSKILAMEYEDDGRKGTRKYKPATVPQEIQGPSIDWGWDEEKGEPLHKDIITISTDMRFAFIERALRQEDEKVEALKTENEELRAWILQLEGRIEALENNIR